MESLILIGAGALLLAMMASAPTPQQPPIIFVQPAEPAPASGGGCLALILGLFIFAALAAMVAAIGA